MRLSPWLHRLLIAIGCVCFAAVGINLVRAASFQITAGQAFEHDLVSEKKTARDTFLHDGVVGRLEIPRLNLSVMVMEGDDEATLARAVGHVSGTAFPWEDGNAVLAGHRDTFFRPLKDLREGDAIRMTTTRGTFDYRAMRTDIVQPDNLSVLAPTPERSLTLLTCYPFVYVGHAPQRFVIRARLR